MTTSKTIKTAQAVHAGENKGQDQLGTRCNSDEIMRAVPVYLSDEQRAAIENGRQYHDKVDPEIKKYPGWEQLPITRDGRVDRDLLAEILSQANGIKLRPKPGSADLTFEAVQQ